jgi:hypothetical protein
MIENHPFFDTVTLEKDMDVALAARLAEVSEAEFRALNPSMHRPVILAAGSPQILLPWDNAAIFKRNLQYHIGPLASWTAWAVPSHMRTADIAKRFGMPETDLRSLNQIPPSMLVKAGSTLLVPRASEHQAEVPEHLADNGQVQFQPEVVRQRGSAKARKGETVASLARRLCGGQRPDAVEPALGRASAQGRPKPGGVPGCGHRFRRSLGIIAQGVSVRGQAQGRKGQNHQSPPLGGTQNQPKTKEMTHGCAVTASNPKPLLGALGKLIGEGTGHIHPGHTQGRLLLAAYAQGRAGGLIGHPPVH